MITVLIMNMWREIFKAFASTKPPKYPAPKEVKQVNKSRHFEL